MGLCISKEERAKKQQEYKELYERLRQKRLELHKLSDNELLLLRDTCKNNLTLTYVAINQVLRQRRMQHQPAPSNILF